MAAGSTGTSPPGAPSAPSASSCARRARARRREGGVAIVIADNLRTHTPAGSKLVRQLLAECGGHLRLVYTPPYDPDADRIEWLWRVSRRAVTHTHQRTTLETLSQDGRRHSRALQADPAAVLRHIGSPFACAAGAAADGREIPLAA